ncbi:dolichol kinase-like [Ptychodera flava]|uniref:dolichol kinase-like n=1 Tax=Ptychodera flava TaxID=63121 RepID=UPI00396A5C04
MADNTSEVDEQGDITEEREDENKEEKSSDEQKSVRRTTLIQFYEYCVLCVAVLSVILTQDWYYGLTFAFVAIFSLHVSATLQQESLTQVFGWQLRPEADNGITTGTVLVPLALLSNAILVKGQTEKDWQELLEYLLPAIGISVVTAFNVLQCSSIYNSQPNLYARLYWYGMIFSVGLLPMLGGTYSTTVLGTITGFSVLVKVLSSLPWSFTIGEAVVLSEGIILLSIDTVMNVAGYSERPQLHSCIQVLILGALFIGLAMYPTLYTMYQVNSMKEKNDVDSQFLRKWSISFYVGTAVFILSVLQSWLWYLLGRNPILFALFFLLDNPIRVCLVLVWLLLVAVSIALVAWHSSPSRTHIASTTTIRKHFHIVATVIFTSGLLIDPDLLYLGAAGTFSIFVILEYIRVFRIKPFGDVLHGAFSVFKDEKDAGIVILTHIYLLIGFSLPVWLYPLQYNQGPPILLYSGCISLGVGDTAAALIGCRYGTHKWPGSNKSKEGTVAAIISQIIFCFLLSFIGVQIHSWLVLILSVLLTSLMEAFTKQIDNIVLPLFMYSMLTILSQVSILH